MSTPGDLQERFDRAAARVPVTPGDVDDVMARGRARRRRRRAAGIASAVAVAVLAGTAIPQLLTGAPPVSVDPVDEVPTSPGEEDPAGVVLTWSHSRYGPDGVTRHVDPDGPGTILLDEGVERAIGTPDGGVVVQREAGAPIELVTPDGGRRELLPGQGAQRLLAVDEDRVFFTHRSDPDGNGEDEEQLLSVTLAGDDAITGHGVSAGIESSTDALAFGPGDEVAWLSCHLQCRVLTGGLDALVGDAEPTELTADRPGWYGALAYSPDGSALAVLAGSDPVVGGTGEVVLLDPDDGRELGRVGLDVELEVHAAAASFTPDGRSLLAGDHLRALLVDDVAGDAPRAEPLAGDGGVTLHVPEDEAASGEEPPSPDGPEVLALTFAAEELGWPDAVVEESDGAPTRPEGSVEQTSVGLRQRPDAPVAVLSLTRDGPAGPWRISGGGHHAEDPEDMDGWWNSVQARDGTIRLAGHAPAWGGERMTAWLLDGDEDRTSSGPVEVGPDGTFEAVLEVREQRDRGVQLLLVTLDADDEVTSFVILGIPAGEFAAG